MNIKCHQFNSFEQVIILNHKIICAYSSPKLVPGSTSNNSSGAKYSQISVVMDKMMKTVSQVKPV